MLMMMMNISSSFFLLIIFHSSKNINKHTHNKTPVIMLQEPAHQKGDQPQCQASTKKGKNTRARQRSRER